jgi:hypothetical protein
MTKKIRVPSKYLEAIPKKFGVLSGYLEAILKKLRVLFGYLEATLKKLRMHFRVSGSHPQEVEDAFPGTQTICGK